MLRPGEWAEGERGTLSDLAPLSAGRFDRASQPHLFDRFDWLSALHDHCMADMTPRIMQAGRNGQEAWLFLANAGGRRLAAIANWYSFAFRPVFVGAPAEETRQDLLETIARDLGREAAQVTLYPVLASDGTRDLFLTAFRQAGWFVVARPMGVNHVLDLNGRDFATYWRQRPGTLRGTVRRKGRDAALRFELHDRFSQAIWDDYAAVYRRSWKGEEPNADFLRAIARQEGAAGTLRLGIARRQGEPVAVQLWTIEQGRALIHKLAHDADADAASPGTLLSHFMFRQAIDVDRVATIDYGTGDNPYKTQWMESRRALYRIDCFNPRFASAWLPALRTAISNLVG